MAAQAETESHGRGVDDVETCMLLRQGAFHVSRQPFLQLSAGMAAVQQEDASVLELGDYVVLSDVALVVTCDEVRMLHIIGALHRLAAEAEMGLGDAEGFLGVVFEIRLSVHAGKVADDMDGILVGTDGTVAAESPELAAEAALGSL